MLLPGVLPPALGMQCEHRRGRKPLPALLPEQVAKGQGSKGNALVLSPQTAERRLPAPCHSSESRAPRCSAPLPASHSSTGWTLAALAQQAPGLQSGKGGSRCRQEAGEQGAALAHSRQRNAVVRCSRAGEEPASHQEPRRSQRACAPAAHMSRLRVGDQAATAQPLGRLPEPQGGSPAPACEPRAVLALTKGKRIPVSQSLRNPTVSTEEHSSPD